METTIQKNKCLKCKKELSDQENLDCEQQKFLPMCSEHLAYYKNIFTKCRPLFSKIKL